MKIEIEVEQLDKTIAGLARAMGDSDFEGIITRMTLSFISQKPDEWFSEERKVAFEKKYNEEVGNENMSYRVLSIKKIVE